jgi:hypothetical protein
VPLSDLIAVVCLKTTAPHKQLLRPLLIKMSRFAFNCRPEKEAQSSVPLTAPRNWRLVVCLAEKERNSALEMGQLLKFMVCGW